MGELLKIGPMRRGAHDDTAGRQRLLQQERRRVRRAAPRILDGRLEAGSRLTQYVLADKLGISITPLREAIRRLSSEGLVDLDAHRNARVAPMGAAEARELFEIRLALDRPRWNWPPLRRTDADIERMRAGAGAAAAGDPAMGRGRARRAPRLPPRPLLASHNDVLIELLDGLWDRSDRYRRLGLELPAGEEPRTIDLKEHHQILDLVVARDAAAAGALTRRHTQKSLTAAAINSLEDPHQTSQQDTV